MQKQLYATDIEWETDGQGTCGLPKEVLITGDTADDYNATQDNFVVLDYLSDEYGFLVNSCNIELK